MSRFTAHVTRDGRFWLIQTLGQIDAWVSSEFRSRAEVLRTAVREMLARRREAEIDADLAAGYGVRPPDQEDKVWADLSVEGLQAADLDW